MVFPPLCLSFTAPLFILSSLLFSPLPRCLAKATDHQSPQRDTLIAGVFDTTCQNRPHCLISACDIFFLFFISLPPRQHLFCMIPLCQIPPWMSRGSLFLTNDRCKQPLWDGWLMSLDRLPSCILIWTSESSVFWDPQLFFLFFFNWSYAWQPTLTRLIRDYDKLKLTKCSKGLSAMLKI